jgi:hypothetical protein
MFDGHKSYRMIEGLPRVVARTQRGHMCRTMPSLPLLTSTPDITRYAEVAVIRYVRPEQAVQACLVDANHARILIASHQNRITQLGEA